MDREEEKRQLRWWGWYCCCCYMTLSGRAILKVKHTLVDFSLPAMFYEDFLVNTETAFQEF